MARYLRILRTPGAWPLFAAAVVARLPISMAPLGLVLLVQQVRGSYSIAGGVTAAFAAGSAVGAPGWGRLLDRRGQSPVVGPLAATSAALLVALTLGAVGGRSDLVLVVLAAGVGLTFPPVSPAVRAAWRAVLPAEADRRAAYALDAVAIETIFVGGPLLLSLLLGPGVAALPLLVTAGLLFVGGVGYALTPAARQARPGLAGAGVGPEPAAVPVAGPVAGPGAVAIPSRSPLRDRGVLAVLAVAVSTAVGFGLTDLAIAATAREVLGGRGKVGLLFTAIAGGSAIGGLWYGSRAWKGPEHRRLPFALAGFTTGLATTGTLLALGPGDSLPVLMPVLFVTGLCISPGMIVLANLVDRHGPPRRLAEAQAWLNTAFTAGSALGTAAAGFAVDAGGPGRGFTVAAVAVGLAFVASLAGARRWSRADGR